MAAIICIRFPEKASELWAYQATIIRAERNYKRKRWVTYDCQFRCQALAKKDLNWSITDPRLYNEAFTGRAQSIARCLLCLQDDHSAAHCPHNPTARTWGESRSYLHGQHSSLPTTTFHPGPPHRRFAAASMKGGARASDAGTAMPAAHATDTMV